MSVLKRMLHPSYVYWWFRLRRHVQRFEFCEAQKYIFKLQSFDRNRRYEFHLKEALVTFANGDFASCYQTLDYAVNLVMHSPKLSGDDKRYLIVYSEKIFLKLKSHADVSDKNFEALQNSLEKARIEMDVPRIKRDNIDRNLLRRFPI